MPLATVLIPTQDHADTIRWAIASVRAQTVQDFELFVVGDGAPPRTDEIVAELAAQDPRIRYFPNAKGAGHGEAHRARALERARGDIVCYLCDDDLWLPHHLETIAALLETADLAHTSQVNMRSDGRPFFLGGDVNAPLTRQRMMDRNWNLFGPTCAGHTLSAYRRLPDGWQPRPDGIYSDLHMWRQWLRQPWCRALSDPALTALNFPVPGRRNWTLTDRIEELESWWQRLRDPGFQRWLEAERLRQWQRRCERPHYFFELGDRFEKCDDLESAEMLFRRAIEAEPAQPSYLKRLSTVLVRRGAAEEALTVARAAIELTPKDPYLHHHLGNLLGLAGRNEEAITAYARAIEIDDSNAQFHHRAALCLTKLGRLDQALEFAETAAKMEPDRTAYQQHLGKLRSLR